MSVTIVHGQIDTSEMGEDAYRVVVIEETFSAHRVDDHTRTNWPRTRVVGTADTDENGGFRIEFTPTEPPPEASDWAAFVRVWVYGDDNRRWRSRPARIAPVVEFRPLAGDEATAGPGASAGVAPVEGGSLVHGHLTANGRPASGFAVTATESAFFGEDQPGEPCVGAARSRQVGNTVTDAAGAYRIRFMPYPPGNHCQGPSGVRIDVADGPTHLWRSGGHHVTADVTIDGELFPDYPAGASLIRVRDEDGARVEGAEVFVDGALKGTTDGFGQLPVVPPLSVGQQVAARKLVREQPTGRPGHSDGGITNWSFRVYVTSIRVRYDANGDNVRLPLAAVMDAATPVDLLLRKRNTVIGFNLTASIEWDASEEERARIRDRLVETSELLYNATDGQMLIERLFVGESGARWDHADIRIYADFNHRSETTSVGALFTASGGVRMNPSDAFFAGVFFHEFGHYLIGPLDEYEKGDNWDPANGAPRCTLRSSEVGTAYGDGGRKDSCFLRGAQERNKKKLCSSHPDNPHVDGTEQGPVDCWTVAINRYRDPAGSSGQEERYKLSSPATRGVIVDRLPDSGVPLHTTTAPPGGDDVDIPSFIPVAGWKPRVSTLIDHRGTLVTGVIVRTELNGVPVRRQNVSLRRGNDGRRLYQGRTAHQYVDKPYGLHSGDGELPLRGTHVGDQLLTVGVGPDGGLLIGQATITNPQPHTLVVALTPVLWPFDFTSIVLGPGELSLELQLAAAAREEPAPDIFIRADGGEPRMRDPLLVGPSDRALRIGGLPPTGDVIVAAIGWSADQEITDEWGITLARTDEEATPYMTSSDGQLKLRLRPGTFDEPCQLAIESPSATTPLDTPLGPIVAGPYTISSFPDVRWARPAKLVFRPPAEELADPDDLAGTLSFAIVERDHDSGQWRDRGDVEIIPGTQFAAQVSSCGRYALVRRGTTPLSEGHAG